MGTRLNHNLTPEENMRRFREAMAGSQAAATAAAIMAAPRGSGSGAAAAAGVLTAIDEDSEGDDEAPVPHDFEYFSDAEDPET